RGIPRCGGLPLEFRREALAVPIRKGFGFVVADVTDRPRGVNRARNVHCATRPAITIAGPVLGRLRAAFGKPAPAGVRPELLTLVAAVGDELEIPTVGYRIAIDQKGAKVDLVPRPLVVVGGAPVIRPD